MFDFEKLQVYHKSKLFYKSIIQFINSNTCSDRVVINQLKRAALSIPLNIAEGTSRYSKPDRRNFYVIARGSLFECVAIFDILKDTAIVNDEDYQKLYTSSEELSKMLYSMIQKLG